MSLRALAAATVVAFGNAVQFDDEDRPLPSERRWKNNPSSGRAVVNQCFVRSKLGEKAWKVYVFLLKKRDWHESKEGNRHGEVWWSAASIAKELKTSRTAAAQALVRLRDSGLVKPRPSPYGTVREDGWYKKRGQWVYSRIVYGSFCLGGRMKVPREAFRKLSKLGRGGARKGAGRKSTNLNVGRNSKVINPNSKVITNRKEDPDLLASQGARGSAAGETAAGSSSFLPAFPTASGPTGAFLGGDLPPAVLPPEALRLLPPPPSFQAISPPVVPPPPLLPEDTSSDFATLEAAYSSAAEHETGHAPSPYARKAVSQFEMERTLGACADKLRAHQLPPIVWAVWSIRVYNQYAVQAKAKRKRTRVRIPPSAWVFNPARVEKHHGWCRTEMGDALGGNVCIPPSALELQRRWRGLQAEVARMREPTVERVRAARDAWLPPGEYDALTAKAAAEAEAKREALAQGLAQGRWIW